MPPSDRECVRRDLPGSPVLHIGNAIAVLTRLPVVTTTGDRLAAAEHELRAVTGDNAISIGLRESGRPKLLPPHPELGVSLSHRGQVLLAAFSPSAPVGCDVELDDPAIDHLRLARDHFAAGEALTISSLAEADARDLFFRFWVGKEAVLKLTGRGVHDGLAAPDLSKAGIGVAQEHTVRLPASAVSPAVSLIVRRLDAAAGCVYAALAREE